MATPKEAKVFLERETSKLEQSFGCTTHNASQVRLDKFDRNQRVDNQSHTRTHTQHNKFLHPKSQ